MIAVATVISKHRITVPKKMREDLGVEAGDKINFTKQDGDWVIHAIPKPKKKNS